jgi:hypothetical protein
VAPFGTVYEISVAVGTSLAASAGVVIETGEVTLAGGLPPASCQDAPAALVQPVSRISPPSAARATKGRTGVLMPPIVGSRRGG